MGFLRRLLLVGALGALSFGAPSARGQQPAAPVSAERLERARKHMEEGQALYGQKKYLEAAQAFQQAYTAQPFAAFLFNEAVCYEKAGEDERALSTFRRYLTADPNPPDAEALRARIKRIEERIEARRTSPSAPPPPVETHVEVMHSLLVFESSPAGAPGQVWQRTQDSAAAFVAGGNNPGWKLATSGPTPLVATLAPGRYHVVIDPWRSYNRAEDDLDVTAGRIVQFRAALSQGDFMGFLRVTSEVDGATVYLDDPPPHQKKPWGVVPHGELLPQGQHTIWVESPGYEPFTESFSLSTGQQKTIAATLERVGYGYLVVDGNAGRITLFLDGSEVGVYEAEEGPVKIKASRGVHRLKAVARNKKVFEGDVEVPAGQEREVHVVLSSVYGRGGAWGTAIASATTLGVGIYLGVRSQGLLDDLRTDRRAGRLASDDERIKQGRIFAIAADVSFSVSFLLASFSAYEFLRDPYPPSTVGTGETRDFSPDKPSPRRTSALRPWRLTPVLSTQQGSLLLQGSF